MTINKQKLIDYLYNYYMTHNSNMSNAEEIGFMTALSLIGQYEDDTSEPQFSSLQFDRSAYTDCLNSTVTLSGTNKSVIRKDIKGIK